MSKAIVTSILSFFLSMMPATDKAAHFGMSALGTATTLKLLGPEITNTERAANFIFWTSVGVYKEYLDTKVDADDIRANFFGVIYGNILMMEF